MIKRILRALKDDDLRRDEDRARIKRVLDALQHIKSGRSLFEFAKDTKLNISYDESISAGEATFKPFPRKILLSPYSNEEMQTLSLAHELRHAWQESKNLNLRAAKHLYDNLINVRFSEADCFSLETQIAWELQQAHPDSHYFRQMKKSYPELARDFQRVAKLSDNNLENGSARLAAFDAWFKCCLRSQYDYAALRQVGAYWKRKSRGIRNGIVFNRIRSEDEPPYMSEDFLREFGAMDNAQNCLEKRNLFADLYIGKLSRPAERYIERISEKHPGSDNSLIYDFL